MDLTALFLMAEICVVHVHSQVPSFSLLYSALIPGPADAASEAGLLNQFI
jgi:hypothetical protein